MGGSAQPADRLREIAPDGSPKRNGFVRAGTQNAAGFPSCPRHQGHDDIWTQVPRLFSSPLVWTEPRLRPSGLLVGSAPLCAAFTLVEMLAVLAVIIILLGLVAPFVDLAQGIAGCDRRRV